MDPDKLVEDLNELLKQDRRTLERMLGIQHAAGGLAGHAGLTCRKRTSDLAVFSPLDLLNVAMAQDGYMILPVVAYPQHTLMGFRKSLRLAWLTDPRPAALIIPELPTKVANDYQQFAPEIGERVRVASVDAYVIRDCFPDAFVAICETQTLQGVMLARDGDFAMVQFGASDYAVPINITLLYTHKEDVENRGKPKKQADEEATGNEDQEVQRDGAE